MKFILLLTLLISLFNIKEIKCLEKKDITSGDVKNIEYGIRTIPADIIYSGTPVAMVTWEDKSGKNLLFVTETEENFNGDIRSKELYAYHFIIGEKGSKQVWKMYDFIKECPVDLTLAYINESLNITDLDNDGIAESSLIYKMSCTGDVSADGMKLIMHEGEKKYALRGSMNLIMNGQELEKGSMKVDPSFNSAPDEFLEFAKGQWSKFKTEKIGE